jgi:hypothetical protein
MAIHIERSGAGYDISATPPHVPVSWRSDSPMSATQVIDALKERGCHQTDIGDALYTANPRWLEDQDIDGRRL